MPQPQVSPSNIAGFPALRTAGTADRPLLLFIHGAFASHEPFANWMQTLGRDGGAASRPAVATNSATDQPASLT